MTAYATPDKSEREPTAGRCAWKSSKTGVCSGPAWTLARLRKAAAPGEAESALLECWSSREHRRRAEGLAAGDRAASEKQLTEVLRALGREHQLRSSESYAAELAAAQFPEYVFDSPGAHALPEWAP